MEWPYVCFHHTLCFVFIYLSVLSHVMCVFVSLPLSPHARWTQSYTGYAKNVTLRLRERERERERAVCLFILTFLLSSTKQIYYSLTSLCLSFKHFSLLILLFSLECSTSSGLLCRWLSAETSIISTEYREIRHGGSDSLRFRDSERHRLEPRVEQQIA